MHLETDVTYLDILPKVLFSPHKAHKSTGKGRQETGASFRNAN
ncbi:hypothetical protein SAMN03080601_01590 [Alkalitalea saponilacus]|uniref:Uncharacterized protein n=1 Tax=Alkalitalea saponilacus TaxID=889453 RepID=A0A1T5FIP0_9BACT|nr:hypothetical protein SAMN03080601_01590 [Alkalitalea saponilacus]